MSLNVGALYVRSSKRVARKAILTEIERYWSARGAERDSRDPLHLEPLSLARTGRLGFAVSDARKGFIAIYDSERYTADAGLAEHLAGALDSETWLVRIDGATDGGTARCWGAAAKPLRSADAVERFWKRKFPYPFLYFDDFGGQSPPPEVGRFSFLALKNIPPGRGEYSGATPAKRATADGAAVVRDAIRKLDLAGTRALLARRPELEKAATAALLDVPQTARGRAFLRKMEPLVLKHARSAQGLALSLIEAQAIEGDDAGMRRVGERLRDVTGVAQAMFERGYYLPSKPGLKVLLLALEMKGEVLELHNNVLVMLFGEKTLPPRKRLDGILDRAVALAPRNPFIFHSAACLFVRLGSHERALDMVEGAVKYRYEHLDLVQKDQDLKPIWKTPRFQAAFARGRRKTGR